MPDQDLEKQVLRAFESLPYKPLPIGDKERAWLRVQNFIRDTRLASPLGTKGLAVSRYGWLFGKTAVVSLVVVISVAGIAGGVAKAAKGSIPGETLYPVKKAVERVEIAIAATPEKKVNVLKNHARERLEEVNTLVTDRPNIEIQIVTKTIQNLQNTTASAHRVAESVRDTKPLLVAEVIEITEEGTRVLARVVELIEQEEIKTAINDAILVSRESIDRLRIVENKDGVKGVVFDEGSETVLQENPTTTPPVITRPPLSVRAPKLAETEDAPMHSGIRLGDIIESNPDGGETDPEILNQPNF